MKTGNQFNRRNFIKKSVQTAAFASMIPAGFKKSTENTYVIKKDDFIYRTLGRTGIKIPVISMGAGDTDNPNLIKAALNEGIVLLATSAYYGNGANEQLIGSVIKDRTRDSFLVMTSAMPAGVNFKEGLFTSESTTEHYLKKLDESLERLNLDYVDIFLLPFAAKRESVFFEPLLKAMETAKKQGKAKFIGVATHSWEPEAITAAAETGIYDVAMTAYNFRKTNLTELDTAIDKAVDAGMGIIAMKTMAGNYWDKEKTQPINAKASLKWVIKNENIHTTVPGFTTFDQLTANISIMKEPDLTEQEKSDLKLAQKTNRHGIYCQQCGQCIGQCPENIDIPTIMRSYMYAYGYGNLRQAKKTYELAETGSVPCTDCKTCYVDCKMGFDIRSKMLDISRLKEIPGDMLV